MNKISYHLLPILLSGLFLISCGGDDDDDNNEVEPDPDPIEDTNIGSWTEGATIPTARKEIPNAVVNIDEMIYVVSGVNPVGNTVGALEVYNPATDEWTKLADLPVNVWRASASAHNGNLYVFGGYTGETFPFNPISKSHKYNLETDTWSEVASMPFARGATAAETLGDKIYVMGGASNSALSTVQIYDPLENTWQTGSSMSTTRSGLGATVFEDKIYVFGGYELGQSGVVSKSSVEVFIPTSGWQSLSDMPIDRLGQTAAAIKGKIYVFGGQANSDVNSRTLEYDPQNDTWRQVADMPIPVSFGGSATVGESIFVIGGGAINLNRRDAVSANRIFTAPK
jgi:N-acetylneuraminic acid mutarotase